MAEVLANYSQQSSSLRPSASHRSFFDSSEPFDRPRRRSSSHTDLRSATSSNSSTASFHSTPFSSGLSLDTTKGAKFVFDECDEDSSDDDGLVFPAYSSGGRRNKHLDVAREVPPSSPVCVGHPPSSPAEPTESTSATASNLDPLPPHSEDDTAVKIEPSHHVDYLSYEWKEEDIWSSWRHIVERRSIYGERSRLENASWRTWAKAQFQLRTVNPETLNWSKDCDVTWLYGPLQPASNRSASQHPSEPPSRLSKTSSFLHKKPILKKRSMSEVMLQNCLSQSSLVEHAAATVQAQQRAGGTPFERRRHRPPLGTAQSDFVLSSIPSRTTSRDPTDYFSSQSSSSSGVQTPEHAERRHIRFDDKVEQCIAVECKDMDDDDDDFPAKWPADDSDSENEGVVMMKRSRKKRPLSRTNSKSSFMGENKIIEKLEPTTLKYRTDSPEVGEQQHHGHSLFGFYRSSRLSPSPSQETIRPSNPSTNFLIPGDDAEEEEDSWDPAGAFEVKRPGTPSPAKRDANMAGTDQETGEAEAGGLRRTASGMFMPFEDEDSDAAPPGIIGRVVDTVNTARDIAHVIWNVGWRN